MNRSDSIAEIRKNNASVKRYDKNVLSLISCHMQS